ncbi:MAG TPA: polysaccharide biosynthesis tyrosine autokinase [Planctomycetota bacterium]|nr:polysaccharide biosynthesis tyrosine autokinase [Planctomycetota bacterium]
MFLKSAIRAGIRRWPLAAAVAGGVALAGLFVIPRPFSFTAQARVVPLAGRWSPGRVQDFALGDAVLTQAARSLGYEEASELRPGLSARAEPGAVLLSMTAATQARAVERVNAVGRSLERLSSSTRRAELDASLQQTDEALAVRRRELDGLSPSVSPADRAIRERIDALEKSLEADRVEIAAAGARIDSLGRAVERNETGPARAVNTADSDRLTAELDLARRQLEELRAAYPEDWPPVIKAAAQVEELRLRRATAANREILEARFAPLRESIEELRAVTAKREALRLGLPAREEELRKLRLRPDAPSAQDDSSAQGRARQDGVAASLRDLEGIRSRLLLERAAGSAVIDRFEPAGGASFSGASLPLLLAIALAAGWIVAGLSEQLAVTLRTEQDVRRYVNLPLLAVIPREKDPALRLLPAAGQGLTEAFNTLAALLEARTKEDGSRLFAITSSSPSEGKSTVACNAAVALARAGSRVLLVDADLRRGTQHQLFSVSNEPGLSAYLQGGTDTVDSMVSATDVDNLTLMPAGAPMQNPIPFLHAERFHALLRDLRGWYEYILVDLPPVRSAADALIVAPLADAVVLVAASSETRKDDMTYTKRMIRSVKSKLCGCVLTKADVRSGGYYYYPSAVPADATE